MAIKIPSELEGLFDEDQLEKLEDLSKSLGLNMASVALGEIKGDIDGFLRSRIEEISGGNPFAESALNTGMNYSRSQLAAFFVEFLRKGQRNL